MIDTFSNPLLQSIAQTQQQREVEAEQASNELGQDAFLRLMIAQLNNQDPLNPQENGEFISQLAEFSSVEGITNINNSIGVLVDETRSSRTLEASALVGKTVEIDGNTAALGASGSLTGSYALESSSASVTLTVRNATGGTVYAEDLGVVAAGEQRFQWDGQTLDGSRAPAGTYSVTVSALQDGSSVNVPVRTADTVESVFLSEDNSVILNLASGRSVGIDEVRRLSDANALNVDERIDTLLNGLQSSRVLAATGLVGESVSYQVQSLVRQPGDPAFVGSVVVPEGIDGGDFTVTNQQGQIVYSEEFQGSGAQTINWQGVDDAGVALSAGEYQLSFTGNGNGQAIDLPIVSSDVVASVTAPQSGAVTLNTLSGNVISVDQLI